MSALRTMLAALWAAVWVRWKLLAVRARRAFGGKDPAAAGSGYYLSAAEIPVEGIDYDETFALVARYSYIKLMLALSP